MCRVFFPASGSSSLTTQLVLPRLLSPGTGTADICVPHDGFSFPIPPTVESLNNIYIDGAAEHGGPVYRAQFHQTGGGGEQGTGPAAKVFPHPAHPLLGPPQD